MLVVNIPELPSCRYRKNSDPPEASAEAFRDDVLIPALLRGKVLVQMNPKYGVPVSWNEEVFGGLVRKLGSVIIPQIQITSKDHMDDAKEAAIFMQEQADRSSNEE